MSHKLKLDVQGSILVAYCQCGQWKESLSFHSGERPSEVVRRLEATYEKHVLESKSASVPEAPPPEPE